LIINSIPHFILRQQTGFKVIIAGSPHDGVTPHDAELSLRNQSLTISPLC